MHLDVKNLRIALNGEVVLDDVSFSLEQGQIGCLLGPSGSGKTTALRAIAGFQTLAGGAITAGGQLVSSAEKLVPPEHRGMGMVFQDYALMPHLTVKQNIAFGLHRLTPKAARDRVAEVIEQVGLNSAAQRYPHELSGGQQQRVALARAVAPRPRLLLLDEPFSNLDAELRERLSTELRDFLKNTGITALLVTHDQLEAFAIAEEIGLLENGKLVQWDTPYNLYHRPATRFVADFIGSGVFLAGKVEQDGCVVTEVGELYGKLAGPSPVSSASVDVLIRPDDVVYDPESLLRARIVRRAFRGAEILYTLELDGGTRLLTLVASHHNHRIGDTIGIRLDTDHLVVFPT